jgi:hypothetical protein
LKQTKSCKSTEIQEPKKGRGPGFKEHPERINRMGRPKKGETFTDLIREQALIKDAYNDAGQLIERKRAIVEKLYSKAIKDGDFLSIKYLIDRVDPAIGEQPPTTGGGDLVGVFQAIIIRATTQNPDMRRDLIRVLENAEIAT